MVEINETLSQLAFQEFLIGECGLDNRAIPIVTRDFLRIAANNRIAPMIMEERELKRDSEAELFIKMVKKAYELGLIQNSSGKNKNPVVDYSI